MSNADEQKNDERKRTRDAVRIIRRLDENPDDQVAQQDRDAFLKRGERERATYARTIRALGSAEKGLRRDQNKRYVVALLGGILALLALAWEPLKIAVIADFQSGRGVEAVVVASGETIILDAASAISYNANAESRSVTLLAGAGYFDIDTSEQSFIVRAGDLTVETLGTAFEVSIQGSVTHVSVAEGAVLVREAGEVVEVEAGERVRWSELTNAQPEPMDETAIAAWRNDLLVTDGMTVAEVAAIIDRRLPGPIMVMTDELRQTVVSGRLDLSRPSDALRTLGATVDANVIEASPLGILIRP